MTLAEYQEKSILGLEILGIILLLFIIYTITVKISYKFKYVDRYETFTHYIKSNLALTLLYIIFCATITVHCLTFFIINSIVYLVG